MMKKKFMIFTVILMIFMASACGKEKESYNAGIAALREGNYEEAIRSLLLAVSQGMDDPFVKADLALAYEKSGQMSKALEYLNEAVQAAPEDPAVLKRIGRFYLYAGDSITALRYFGQSLRTPEDQMSVPDLESTAYAAEIEARYGNYDEAIRLYNTLITQNYMVQEHQLLAGMCYLRMHQLSAACQYFDLLIADESTAPEYFLIIYHALCDRGFSEEAEPYFQEGLDRCDREGTISRGEYCADAFRTDLAEEEGLDGSSTGTMLAKAVLLREEGDQEGAEEIYIDLIQKGEDLEKIYNQYMILKAEQGDFPAAFRLLSYVQTGMDAAAKKDADWNEIILYEMQRDYATAFRKLEEYMKNYTPSETVWREHAFLSRAALGY